MIKTQKNCADLLLLKAFDASKGRISNLRRFLSNIIIMLRFVKDRNSQLRHFTSVNYFLCVSCKNRETTAKRSNGIIIVV